jgi:hypothetical protein
MKIGYLITVISIIYLTGCTTTYTDRDFYSEGIYFNNFNNGALNNTIKITLTNDSTYKWQYGAYISYDSLILKIGENEYNHIPINKIKKISYKKPLPGMGVGILAGIPIGFICGVTAAIFTTNFNSKEGSTQSSKYYFGGLIFGPIAGGILGALFGWNYTYIFNP